MKFITIKSLVGLAAACLSINPALFAKEVGGIAIPENLKLGPESTELVLNGAGVRKKFFQKIYVAGLYLSKRADSVEEVLAMPGYKRISMHFIYSEVSQDKIVDAWNEGLENNQDAASLTSLRPRLEAFNRYFETMHAGDEILLDYFPDEGTKVCRYLVKDFGTSKSPKSTRLRDHHWAPAALRPRRFATPSHARRRLRTAPTNGWTAFRM